MKMRPTVSTAAARRSRSSADTEWSLKTLVVTCVRVFSMSRTETCHIAPRKMGSDSSVDLSCLGVMFAIGSELLPPAAWFWSTSSLTVLKVRSAALAALIPALTASVWFWKDSRLLFSAARCASICRKDLTPTYSCARVMYSSATTKRRQFPKERPASSAASFFRSASTFSMLAPSSSSGWISRTRLLASSTSRLSWRTCMRRMESWPSIDAIDANANVPMYGSNLSEPKSMVKKTPASTAPFPSTTFTPCWSYLCRVCSSASTWYACESFWNCSFASSLSGFLSGCSLSAFL
mmetsp:Transcript_42242/g.105220  ORF Transcript_42242/g.105220 Transcript_42242/m.105220 type:complete len:293 (+) Transcript_42242:705-1583(+)